MRKLALSISVALIAVTVFAISANGQNFSPWGQAVDCRPTDQHYRFPRRLPVYCENDLSLFQIEQPGSP